MSLYSLVSNCSPISLVGRHSIGVHISQISSFVKFKQAGMKKTQQM